VVGFLIGCGIVALMVYAVAARPSGRKWAYARLLSLGTVASCAITLGVLPVVPGPAAQDVDGGVLVTAYHAFVGLGVFGVLLWLGLALYITRAAWVQWQLVRAGEFAGLTELGERAVELRTLLKETAADRAWIAAAMQRTFATQEEAEAALREIRSREQQIDQRQAKLADLRVPLQPWRIARRSAKNSARADLSRRRR